MRRPEWKAVAVHLQLVGANDVREAVRIEEGAKGLYREVVSPTAANVLHETSVLGYLVELTHLAVLIVSYRV